MLGFVYPLDIANGLVNASSAQDLSGVISVKDHTGVISVSGRIPLLNKFVAVSIFPAGHNFTVQLLF